MKQYFENANITIISEGMSIPMVKGNRHYNAILAEVEAGEAEVIAWEGSDKQQGEADLELEVSARAWRDDELAKADLDLNREQDGMTNYTVSTIRDWRVVLRDWPSTEDFPHTKPIRSY